MRRLLVPAALLLVLVACAPTPAGPRRTEALEQVAAGAGLDVAAARRTVADFLEAYARASADGGRALEALVESRELKLWVHWLSVQNANFPGDMGSTVDLRSLTFAGSVPFRGTVAAQVDLGATVTFEYRPDGDKPFARTRVMDGSVTLLRRGPGEWGVVDATRDGLSMSDSIQIFKDTAATQAGVTVHVDSLFTFPPFWQFNVVVANGSGKDLTLDANGVSLTDKPPPGQTVAVTPSLARIYAGTRAEGQIGFPAQSGPEGLVLTIPFRLGGRVLAFHFPLADLVIPAPAPTASATPPVVTS